MNAAGCGDEALERIREVIRELARNPAARGLEELINSYTRAYLEKHSPEELKEHYYNFPGIRSTDRAARALLRVAVIGVFEGVLKDTDDEARKRSAAAMMRWMQLMWDRNKPAGGSNSRGDRQEAYEGGARYIELTGRFKDKLNDEEQELWTAVEKLVKTYEANPDIKPMAEVKKEKEEASRRR